MREQSDKAIELLSFQANDHPPSMGKAYGEFRLLDTALAHSQLIGPRDRVWKTTGRLRCLNLDRLDQAIVGDVDLACDLHNVPFIGSGKRVGGEMMDLRLFAFRREFYECAIRGRWQAAGSQFDARFMYNLAMESSAQWRVMPRFPLQPFISGISGERSATTSVPLNEQKTLSAASFADWHRAYGYSAFQPRDYLHHRSVGCQRLRARRHCCSPRQLAYLPCEWKWPRHCDQGVLRASDDYARSVDRRAGVHGAKRNSARVTTTDQPPIAPLPLALCREYGVYAMTWVAGRPLTGVILAPTTPSNGHVH